MIKEEKQFFTHCILCFWWKFFFKYLFKIFALHFSPEYKGHPHISQDADCLLGTIVTCCHKIHLIILSLFMKVIYILYAKFISGCRLHPQWHCTAAQCRLASHHGTTFLYENIKAYQYSMKWISVNWILWKFQTHHSKFWSHFYQGVT